ncbi:AAA family ATPase [Methylobacterium sp. ID0610]|uniref:AAA family ATPase n=1 Tax=Methylobacterium carpenticola TaxID=3344827 RepID=UPI0036897A51
MAASRRLDPARQLTVFPKSTPDGTRVPPRETESETMLVVSIVQQKGGVGKTTLAINLAGELRQRKMKVMIIDADPQASATAWSSPRKLGFDVRPELVSSGTVSQWLRNVLKQQADVLIIDTPAGLGPVFRAAVDVADLILIPCGPSSLDLNSARTTLGAVANQLRNDSRSHARVALVPTRVDRETPEGQQITDELDALGEPVGPALSHDVYFVRAFTQGVTVTTAAPASNAAGEIRAVAEFVLAQLPRA